MPNPWEKIPLSDYENHMKLNSVKQLQALNQMMKEQLDDYSVSSAVILGIAGGNGLEHIDKTKFKRVYGVDINKEYLKTVSERYSHLSGVLTCIQSDLTKETELLPKADLLIADLLVEYIGYECFQKAVKQVQPRFVSCIIQINIDDGWVSNSPYIHAFDALDEVHFKIEENSLIQAMKAVGYRNIKQSETPLPNGKKLLQLDFGLTNC